MSLVRPSRSQPRPRSAVQRGLDVVRGLGHGRVGQPLPQRRLVVRGERAHVDVPRLRPPRRTPRRARLQRRLACGQRDARRGRGRPRGQPTPWKARPTRRPSRACASSHARTVPGAIAPPCTSKPSSASGSALVSVANSRSRSTRNSSSSNSRCTASRSHGRATRSSGAASSGDVPDQLGELPVEQHAARGAPAGRRPPCPSPRPPGRSAPPSEPNSRTHLAAVFSPTPGMLGRLSLGVAAQRREIRVLGRGEPVAGHHRVRVDPAELGHPARRVEHRDVLADQLERVAVARRHQHPVALRLGLRGEGGDDVVGLEVVDREERDRQRRRGPP